MASYIGRRKFLAALLGGAASWPLAARAQQPALPVVGFLNGLGQNDRPNLPAAFRRGLGEAGHVDGRNVAIEYRFAENRLDRLPALAADLVSRKVNVIAATGGGASVLAAMAATKTIPIVFTTGGDPVQEGYVASLNRPGGNVTGVSWFSNLIAGKGLGLLHELVPKAALVALLANPKLPETARTQSDAQEAARVLFMSNVRAPNRWRVDNARSYRPTKPPADHSCGAPGRRVHVRVLAHRRAGMDPAATRGLRTGRTPALPAVHLGHWPCQVVHVPLPSLP
jgi:ABC transporter substrate binding protein